MSEHNNFYDIKLSTNTLSNDIEEQRNDLNNNQENNRPIDNMVFCCPICISYAFIIFLMLLLLGGIICYYIFGIMFLVKDYEQFSDCSKSYLWEYVLVSLIMSLINTSIYNSKDKNDNLSFINIIFIFLTTLGLCIWGGIEIFYKLCNDLDNESLTKFATVVFSLQGICSFITLITLCITLYFIKKNTLENN